MLVLLYFEIVVHVDGELSASYRGQVVLGWREWHIQDMLKSETIARGVHYTVNISIILVLLRRLTRPLVLHTDHSVCESYALLVAIVEVLGCILHKFIYIILNAHIRLRRHTGLVARERHLVV